MKKNILLVLLGLLLVLQFIRPDTSVPTVEADQDLCEMLQPPAEVETLLKNACYDCHSYETRYPWYSQIVPVSWWLNNHVQEGREHLNFSTFGTLSPRNRAEALEEAAEEVEEGEMPLNSYTWTHADARLSAEQKNALTTWLKRASRQRTEE